MLRVLILATLFSAVAPLVVFAQTCDSPNDPSDTRIYYINGMNNPPRIAKASRVQLQALMGASYQVGWSINQREGDIRQFIEVYRNRGNEPSIMWRWFANTDLAPTWFKRDFANYVIGHTSVEYSTDLDLRIMINQYLRDLRSGKKVILVAHSQGNFYANNAYQYIALTKPEYANSISIVSVGTPSGAVLGGGRWHSNSLDRVLQIVDTFYSVLPSNFTFSDASDPLNHNFLTTYLAARGSLIRNDVLQLESQLAPPAKDPQCDPTAVIETLDAVAISDESALIGGDLTSGAKADAWVVYGTGAVVCSSFGNDGVGEFSAPTPVLVNIGNLQPSTRYYFRACALGKDQRLSVGELKEFTTTSVNEDPDEIACGNQAFRGGSAGLMTVMDFGLSKGRVDVAFEAFTIPDSMRIFKKNTNTIVLQTPGFVSEINTGSFNVDNSFSKVDVIVFGNSNTNTAWELTMRCPN